MTIVPKDVPRDRVDQNNFVDLKPDTTYPRDGQSYAILWDERSMYPVDSADWPVNIAGERQFFIDDYLIATCDNLRRTVHQPRKHPENPIIVPDQPWEGKRGIGVGTVIRDPNSGEFRMWYYTNHGEFVTADGRTTATALLYATSPDGIRWTKPQMNVCTWKGSTANNILDPELPPRMMYEPEEADPQRRYKIFWGSRKEGSDLYKGFYRLATSPDGIHWTKHAEMIVPMAKHPKAGYRGKQRGFGGSADFDHKLGRYIWHGKVFVAGRRARAMMESDDLIYWTPPRVILCADKEDPPDTQIYGIHPIRYESIWIAPLRVYHWTDFKRVDLQLAHSRDGRHYARTAGRQVFMPNGPSDDGWDSDYIGLSGGVYVDMGEELWIYYLGSRNPARGHDNWQHRIGLAIMKRDRFVSMDGLQNDGDLTTRLLGYAGERLHINADAAGGRIRIAVLDEAGKPLPGADTADCVPCTVDSLDHIVEWKEVKALDPKKHPRIRLRITLRQAALFSFWIA